MSSLHRIRPVLKVDPHSTASVTGAAYAINNGMGKNPALYASPTPSLIVLAAQIVKVETAQQLAGTRAKGAAAARNVQRGILFGMLETECSYVQTLCDAAQGPDQAIAIIVGAGMAVANVATRNDPILKVTLAAGQGGAVHLDANATLLLGKSGRRAFFNWQYTTDGGKTFSNALSTPLASTTISGLTPLTTVGFRVSVTTSKVIGEWSQVVSILVQ